MNIQSIQRHDMWQSHITQWLSSGLSQAEYCRSHKLVLHRFTYWRHKLDVKQPHGGSSPEKKSCSGFIPAFVEPHDQPQLSVSLPNGFRIEGINAASLGLAQQLLEALK